MDSFTTWTFPSTHKRTSSTASTSTTSSPRRSSHHRRQASITALPTDYASTLNAVPPVPAIPAAYRARATSSASSSSSSSSAAAAAGAALTPQRGGNSRHNRNYSITPSNSVLSYSSRPMIPLPSPTRPSNNNNNYTYRPASPRRQSTESILTSSSRGSCSSSSSTSCSAATLNALMANLSEEPGEEVLIDSLAEEADSDDEEFWGCAGLVGGFDAGVKRGGYA